MESQRKNLFLLVSFARYHFFLSTARYDSARWVKKKMDGGGKEGLDFLTFFFRDTYRRNPPRTPPRKNSIRCVQLIESKGEGKQKGGLVFIFHVDFSLNPRRRHRPTPRFRQRDLFFPILVFSLSQFF